MWRHSKRNVGQRDPKSGNFVCEERGKAVCSEATEMEEAEICDVLIYLQFARDGKDSDEEETKCEQYCFLAERISL